MVCDAIRGRFCLVGEGDTGSPRRRFLARETAVVGPLRVRGAGDGDEGADCGTITGKGSGDALVYLDLELALDGVANGFERNAWVAVVVALCFPLLFCGEKGLNVDNGEVVSMRRGLASCSAAWSLNDRDLEGGVEGGSGAAAALVNFL